MTTTLIAHLGHSMHLHSADLLGIVVLSTLIYWAALYVQRPRRVTAGRIRALREYVHAIGRRSK
jgi:hypothetical protein